MLDISDKAKILIIEDSSANIMILKNYLEPKGYDVFSVEDGLEAIAKVHEVKPDLILCDVQMPGMDGFEITRQLKDAAETRLIPIIIVTALSEMNDKIRGIECGAEEYLMKPYNKFELLARVSSLVKFKRLNDQLESTQSTLFALAKAIEAKDKYTEGHSERVSLYSKRLAKKIGMAEEEQEIIRRGALLHDIGKIGIPEQILCKPAPLDRDEYLVMKEHPMIGAKIAEPLRNSVPYINMIKHHHEMYDGSGHPDKLKGEEIPIEARIVSIVDAYDAIVTTRPYRKGSPKEVAFDILRQGKATQWDPNLVDAFIEMMEEWEEEKRLKREAKRNEALINEGS